MKCGKIGHPQWLCPDLTESENLKIVPTEEAIQVKSNTDLDPVGNFKENFIKVRYI